MTRPDLAALRAPAEEVAQERAWPAVRDAFAARERVPRRAPRRRTLALAAAALVVVALTPPGMAVAGYLHDRSSATRRARRCPRRWPRARPGGCC